MLIKKTLLTLMALFMSVSGMPVYAEQAPEPEVTERKDDTAASTEAESTLGIKKLYAEEPETLTTGAKFSATIKTLAAGKTKNRSDWDSLIKAIKVVVTRPSGSITTKDVSARQDGSYLVWWDAGASTIYLYSKSGDIVLNPDSSYMFDGCKSLTTLDVSKWNTSQVTNMSCIFGGCYSLTPLDVSKWNTSSVTNMDSMFDDCHKLTTLDVSRWDTSSVTDMSYMFELCDGLDHIYIGSGWNTGNVTNMNSMFNECRSLTTIDLSGWNTGNVTNMNYMFNNCSSLSALDISNWNTSSVTNMGAMFYRCANLAHIYIGSGWNTDKVTSSGSMFYNCTNLPNFDASVVDKTNAHAGPGGYMTLKS